MDFKFIMDETLPEEVRIIAHQRTSLVDQIENLVLQYKGADRIAGYTEEELRMLSFDEIECITVLEGKTYAIDGNNQAYRLRYRLYEVEKLLPSYFIRINKSSLANETRLVKFAASFNGAINAIFQSGYTDYVSRRCFAEIKRRYDK